MMDKITRYLRLAEEVFLVAESEVPAKTKYELIFSQELSRSLDQLFVLDYYDPDTSYEEDIAAYITALHEKCAEFRQIIGNAESMR